MNLVDFLRARIDEDRGHVWCGEYAHDRNSGGHIDCWELGAECDSRQKREWLAKRRILLWHQDDVAPYTFQILAAVYADHPDYQDDWDDWRP